MNPRLIENVGEWTQLLGVLFIARDLKAYADFRGDTKRWMAKLRAWWDRVLRFLRLRRGVDVRMGEAGMAQDVLVRAIGIGVHLPTAAGPGSSMEERIAVLEQLLVLLPAQLERERKLQDQLHEDLAEKIAKDIAAGDRRLDALLATLRDDHNRLKDTTTGDLHLRWWSLLVLAIGIALASWPEWFASWLPGAVAFWIGFVAVSAAAGVVALIRLRSRPKSG
jgi:hypothetical protein